MNGSNKVEFKFMKWFRPTISIAFLLLIVLIAFQFGKSFIKESVSIEGVRNGFLKVDDRIRNEIVSVVLVNNRSYPIRLVGGQYSCGCMKSSDFPILLPPNSKTNVPIHFEHDDSRIDFQVLWYLDDSRQSRVSCVIRFG